MRALLNKAQRKEKKRNVWSIWQRSNDNHNNNTCKIRQERNSDVRLMWFFKYVMLTHCYKIREEKNTQHTHERNFIFALCLPFSFSSFWICRCSRCLRKNEEKKKIAINIATSLRWSNNETRLIARYSQISWCLFVVLHSFPLRVYVCVKIALCPEIFHSIPFNKQRGKKLNKFYDRRSTMQNHKNDGEKKKTRLSYNHLLLASARARVCVSICVHCTK